MLSQEKDRLLDTHGLVNGDRRVLNDHARNLFLTLHETEYGFEGLTHKKSEVRQQMKGVLIERPTIEDIMLGYVGGDEDAL